MTPDQAGSFLTINLKAVAENWRTLQARVSRGTECGAVLKTDAYGLGMPRVAPVLAQAGCSTFFVAHVFEGIELRKYVPAGKIYVLHGMMPKTEDDFPEYNLIPVLNTMEQVTAWATFAQNRGSVLKAALHVDTGMTRLGLTPDDIKTIIDLPSLLNGIEVDLVLSHLACADTPESPMNQKQRTSFDLICHELKTVLPYDFKRSLCASAGCFLVPEFHEDLTRPGIALYGCLEGLKPAVSLYSKIMQVQKVKAGQPIGYGSLGMLVSDGKVATVALGYGDGYPRSMTNKGTAFVGGKKVRVIGRVSMDLTALDVSDVPDRELFPGQLVEFIGPNCSLSEMARDAGTIEYEILTTLGRRFYRSYVE